jgi:hypothetical protein
MKVSVWFAGTFKTSFWRKKIVDLVVGPDAYRLPNLTRVEENNEVM